MHPDNVKIGIMRILPDLISNGVDHVYPEPRTLAGIICRIVLRFIIGNHRNVELAVFTAENIRRTATQGVRISAAEYFLIYAVSELDYCEFIPRKIVFSIGVFICNIDGEAAVFGTDYTRFVTAVYSRGIRIQLLAGSAFPFYSYSFRFGKTGSVIGSLISAAVVSSRVVICVSVSEEMSEVCCDSLQDINDSIIRIAKANAIIFILLFMIIPHR